MKSLHTSSFRLLLLLAALLVMASPAQAQEPLTSAGQPDFVPGELLVKFKPGLSGQDNELSVADVGGQVVDTIPEIETVKISVPAGQELNTAAQLQARNDVEYVELNYIAYAQYMPNDSYFGSQWGMTKINLPDMLDITWGSSDVVVAVVDTGIDLEHPDFDCTVTSGLPKLTSGTTFVFGTTTPDDDNSHGSHVAGIVGACTDNGIGVTGVAPNVRLMPVKVLNYAGSGSYSDVADGIIWAANNGADIINLSLGGTYPNTTMEDAVKYAYDNGVLVVAASGNSYASSLMYPAAHPQAMAVGATTSTDVRASYSNYGSGLSVVAPGSGIYSTWSNESYGYKSGTSMATPHVAGLAAIIKGLDPALTHTEIQSIIEDTAVDLGSSDYDTQYGHGRINAYAAIESLLIEQFQLPVSENIIPPTFFLTDDETLPGSKSVIVPTSSVAWQSALWPPVDWATVDVTGSGGTLIVSASRPLTYGQYSTNLVLTGTVGVSPTTQNLGPFTIQDAVTISYVPQITRLYFPLITKN